MLWIIQKLCTKLLIICHMLVLLHSYNALDSSPGYHNIHFPGEKVTDNLQYKVLVQVPEPNDIVEADTILLSPII